MLVLVVNAGSSSLKYQLIDMSNEKVMAKGIVERIGESGANGAELTHEAFGKKRLKVKANIADHMQAMRLVFDTLINEETGSIKDISEISAIGHRVVHGGETFFDSVIIDDKVVDTIARLTQLAPLHNPPNLMGIEAAMRIMPNVPHVAVFDTAFHHTLPRHAYIYALPYEFYQKHGVRRYGFHGTSHKYVSSRAIKMLMAQGKDKESLKIITCHLGNGASMAAVVGGKSIDTSMGLTPVEGLVMGTRCGDIDPAIIPFLQKELGYSADDIDNIINKKSGLLGISGISNDMRDIVAEAEAGHKRSQLALDIFCYRIRKYIGAYVAAMGGLDAIVFTAGIGEHSPTVRARICEGLEFFGIELDAEKNAVCQGECDISKETARTRVLVIPTNEEIAIARETVRIITGESENST
ncbi:MAG: acetate kinase [Armatimonadetes bacterium]|nr:acetate kinase [Armatimonadota bacterium]